MARGPSGRCFDRVGGQVGEAAQASDEGAADRPGGVQFAVGDGFGQQLLGVVVGLVGVGEGGGQAGQPGSFATASAISGAVTRRRVAAHSRTG